MKKKERDLPEETIDKYQRYVLNLPKIKGNNFYINILGNYEKFGFEIALLFLLISGFYKLNFVSVFYILIAAYFSKNIYQGQNSELVSLHFKWKFTYSFISIFLIAQYALILWFPLSWNM